MTDLDMLYLHAQFLYETKHFEDALELCNKLIERGYPKAHRLMGIFYRDGKIFRTDLQKAAEYFDKAKEKGDYVAKYYKQLLFEIDLKELHNMFLMTNDFPIEEAVAILITASSKAEKENIALLFEGICYAYSLIEIENELEKFLEITNMINDNKKTEFINTVLQIIEKIKEKNRLTIMKNL